jgi:3'-5' exoribonuclease
MENKLENSKAIAKFVSINKGNGFCNIVVENEQHTQFSLNVTEDQLLKLKLGKVYVFEYDNITKTTTGKIKEIKELLNFQFIDECFSGIELSKYLDIFYSFSPVGIMEIKITIEGFLNQIENKILYNITNKIYLKYIDKFFVHPAATSFHHSYYGGLSYHTYSMLKVAQGMINEYTYLNKDLMYSGIILHDMLKISEITGVDGSYSTQGILIGHLVGGALEISATAKELGYEESEETLLLEHIIISHHGQFNYGSHKKPQIPEALMIWYIDTIDAKFRVIGEELSKTRVGDFTSNLPVADKIAFYKTRIKK